MTAENKIRVKGEVQSTKFLNKAVLQVRRPPLFTSIE